MKSAIRFAASLLALGGLLGSVASHATDVAELPLKASVLAKPNVIFGLDDSGSMDSEVLLSGNDGAFWWDHDAASGWNSSGTLWFNAAGNSSSQWRKMVYLFPNGNSTSDVRNYGDGTYEHFAVMPTAEFAFLRSAAYNPLYYDPAVTYAPWSPAYVSGAAATYSNASTSAARSHPIYGSSTMNLGATVASTTTANFTFTALPGMKVPGTATVCANTSCSPWPAASTRGWTESPAGSGLYRVPANTKMNVAMAYFPATYYQKETCTVNGTSCVSAPDGATLKRYEVKSGNSFPSGRTYAAELQNFANWWTYYRKRKLMLSASMGKVLEPLTGLRMGVVVFNNQQNVTMYDIDSASSATNGRKVAGLFYETNGSGGTPTRETLKYIGDQYRNNASTITYACQRNNAFIVTDGFANATTITPPGYSSATWGPGVPYTTTYGGTLADIALSYFTINLRSGLATGKVARTTVDLNTDLHMNTYGLTLGAKGTLYTGDGSVAPTSASSWPNPIDNRSPTAVDDLWHATINGRGQMYLATTPAETALKIRAGLNDILNADGAQGGVAVSTVNLTGGDGLAYLGKYNPAGWAGDLTANAINSSTGVITQSPHRWSASEKLTARSWSTRVIASATASGGTPFTSANVGTLVNPSGTWGSTDALIDYLRGDRSNEGTTFRIRTSLMGAVISAEPTISPEEKVVYVASGEGMLHAVDMTQGADEGKELWAFVPRAVLADLGQTTARGYAFKTQLDGTPVIGKSGGSTKLLVAGMGAAGRGYYAIDVTSPRDLTETGLAGKFKWEFPTAGDSTTQTKVGQTVGRPVIVRTSGSDGYVVLVTSGYNSTFDGQGRMWMLNASTGAVINEFVVPAGTTTAESGLAHVSPYAEDDGSVRYVYGGDLLGNVWRFDLQAKDTPTKIAVLKNASNELQPVTAAPELAFIQNQRVVIVGTGRILDITDFGNTRIQSIYAISDGATIDPARNSLVRQTYTHSGDAISSNAVDWTVKRGWYMDLPSGEQANVRPAIAYGAVSFVTNVTGATDCSASSFFYVLDIANGSRYANASFVSTTLSTTANSSAPLPVVTSQGDVRGLVQDANGLAHQPQIASRPTIVPSKNSWREIRSD